MRRLATVLLAALAVFLVACEGDAAGGDAPSPTTPPAASTVTAGAGGETPIPQPSETVASTYFTPTSELPLVRFLTSEGSVELPVEVPPRSEYPIGLSGRWSLEGRGMVFYREDFGQGAFWMQNTHVDLDIAFVDRDREILHITTMRADTLDYHRPDRDYVIAIETPAGWYAANGIREGDRVEFLFDLEETVQD